jgi:ankyrin repeat protein
VGLDFLLLFPENAWSFPSSNFLFSPPIRLVLNHVGSQRTPLHWAAARGFDKSLKLLLAVTPRAALSVPDSLGWSVLHHALASEVGLACARELVARGAVDTADAAGQTCLMLAIGRRADDLALALLQTGVRWLRDSERVCARVCK